jgi:hypothetical protein
MKSNTTAYRMHARLDHGAVKLLTHTGLDWTPNIQRRSLPARSISTANYAAEASMPRKRATADAQTGLKLDPNFKGVR